MRVTHLLRQIEMMALLLRDERGDTEWEDADRDRVRLAHTLLAEAVEHNPEREWRPSSFDATDFDPPT